MMLCDSGKRARLPQYVGNSGRGILYNIHILPQNAVLVDFLEVIQTRLTF